MSTKTTLKRIALVAVSALGVSLVSIMPAKAAAGDFVATYSAPSTVSLLSNYSAAANAGTVTINLTGIPGKLLTSSDTATVSISPNSKTAITSGAILSDVATITTTAAHSFVAGDKVTISGFTEAVCSTALNVTATIATVPTTTTFTFTVNSADDTSCTIATAAFVSYERDVLFTNALSFADTFSTTSLVASNAVTNTAVTGGATSAVADVITGAAYTASSGSAFLVVGTGLTTDANGGKAKYSLATSANGSLGSYESTITLSIASAIPGTRTFSPTTRAANIAAGGSATVTVTVPYTNVIAGATIPSETFTLTPVGASTANSTFTVTAVATGGSATVFRNSATSFTANLLKDSITGAFSVTYTITVNAPAGAVQGDTITVTPSRFNIYSDHIWWTGMEWQSNSAVTCASWLRLAWWK